VYQKSAKPFLSNQDHWGGNYQRNNLQSYQIQTDSTNQEYDSAVL